MWGWGPETGPGKDGACAFPGNWGQQVAPSHRAPCISNPWGDWGHRQSLFTRPLIVVSCALFRNLKWQQWFAPTPSSPFKRCPAVQEPEHAEKDVPMLIPTLLLLSSPTMAPCFSCGLRPPPALPWLWCTSAQLMAYHSLAPSQAVSMQPTLDLFLELTFVVWDSMPSPFPGVSGSGTVGLCSSLSALPWLATVLFSNALRFFLHCSWLLHQLGKLLGFGILSSFTVPSQDCSFSLDSPLISYFCSTHLCGGFLALFGSLRPSFSVE